MPTIDREDVPQPFLYAGYIYDRELSGPGESSSWYWLSVRHYDPVLERFVQPDPSQQEGTRSYVYAGDDPLDATDPSGLWCQNFGFFYGGTTCGSNSSPSVDYLGTQQRAMHQVEQGEEQFVKDAYQLTIGGTVSDVQTLLGPNSTPEQRGWAAFGLVLPLVLGPEAGAEEEVAVRAEADIVKAADEPNLITTTRSGRPVPPAGRQASGSGPGQTYRFENTTDPELRAYLQDEYSAGVRYKSTGYPDFEPWSGITVKVANLTGKNGDFYKATEAAGLPRAWYDAQKDWTWHHVEDCETMQLVPKDLHAAVPHAGSTALFGSEAC